MPITNNQQYTKKPGSGKIYNAKIYNTKIGMATGKKQLTIDLMSA